MAVTPKITIPVKTSTLGVSVVVHSGSTIYSNVAAPSPSAAMSKLSGGLPPPTNADGSDPNGHPAAFYAIRNNRVIGPYADLQVAKDTIDWIASREAELGADI